MKYTIYGTVPSVWSMFYEGRFRRNGENEAVELRLPAVMYVSIDMLGHMDGVTAFS